MEKRKVIEQLVAIPTDYALVEEQTEIRNKQDVTILRYQKDGIFQQNGPRIIAVFQKDTLVSLKNLAEAPTGKPLSSDQAQTLAKEIFTKVNRNYARNLSFIRAEHQQREFVDEQGNTRQFSVLWVKFGHSNGSYNWVTLGNDGTLVEMEIDSHWDYFRGRRKTEMWDNDDWVLAREGKGPQLASPNALA